jgi:hypothetical protein
VSVGLAQAERDRQPGGWAHRSRRKIAALFTGGSVSAFVTVHLVHLASAAAAPAAVQFLCRIAH